MEGEKKRLEEELATARAKIASLQGEVLTLEKSNRFLLRKAHEVKGQSNVLLSVPFESIFDPEKDSWEGGKGSGVGGSALAEAASAEAAAAGAAAVAADQQHLGLLQAARVEPWDIVGPFDAVELALRRASIGGAILTDYQQGRSHFDHDDVSAMLLETLMGSMHFLRGEFLYTELKTVTALGDMLTLAKAKVKDGDMTPVRQAFAKQLSALRSFAGRMIKGVDGLDENIDPASRWQITDQHVILSIQLKDARPLLLNVQLLAALFDNLGEKIIADLCYDAGLVKNLEHIIKIALRSAEVLHESSKSGDRALNEMAKVRNWLRSGRKAPRVTTFKRELGMFTDDEANSIVERFEDRLLAEAASDGGGGGGGGSSGGSEEGGAKGIGEDTFLELVVSLCRDAGDKLPGKKDMEKIMEHVRARALPVRDGEAFLRLFASVVAVGKGRSLGVLLDLGAAGTSGGRKKERRASISTSTKAQQ